MLRVVDGFYGNYDAVERLARESKWENQKGAYYSGRKSVCRYIPPEIEKLGDYVVDIARYHSNAKFCLAMESDNGNGDAVHVDYYGLHTAVVYFNDYTIGTDFVLHKKTKRKMWFSGLKTKDYFREDLWKVYKRIPMKKNRCVLFDSRMFHRVGHNFDNRLVQVFFLRKVT